MTQGLSFDVRMMQYFKYATSWHLLQALGASASLPSLRYPRRSPTHAAAL
jgi:hypothetical protein